MKTLLATLTTLTLFSGILLGQKQHDLMGPERKNASIGKSAVFSSEYTDTAVEQIQWKKGPERKNAAISGTSKLGATEHDFAAKRIRWTKGPKRKNSQLISEMRLVYREANGSEDH